MLGLVVLLINSLSDMILPLSPGKLRRRGYLDAKWYLHVVTMGPSEAQMFWK